MSEKDFNDVVEALKTKLTEKPKYLRLENYHYWKEIREKKYDFGRSEFGK